jgi:hypothetical protein
VGKTIHSAAVLQFTIANQENAIQIPPNFPLSDNLLKWRGARSEPGVKLLPMTNRPA